MYGREVECGCEIRETTEHVLLNWGRYEMSRKERKELSYMKRKSGMVILLGYEGRANERLERVTMSMLGGI